MLEWKFVTDWFISRISVRKSSLFYFTSTVDRFYNLSIIVEKLSRYHWRLENSRSKDSHVWNISNSLNVT